MYKCHLGTGGSSQIAIERWLSCKPVIGCIVWASHIFSLFSKLWYLSANTGPLWGYIDTSPLLSHPFPHLELCRQCRNHRPWRNTPLLHLVYQWGLLSWSSFSSSWAWPTLSSILCSVSITVLVAPSLLLSGTSTSCHCKCLFICSHCFNQWGEGWNWPLEGGAVNNSWACIDLQWDCKCTVLSWKLFYSLGWLG